MRRVSRDVLQIALEHHRAGRLTAAEGGYREALRESPDNAEALHWLGVLLLQAGQAAEAVELLEKAAAGKPADAAFLHNLGQGYLAAGKINQAIGAFSRAADAEPGNAPARLALAQACLTRSAPGDAQSAAAALRQALAGGADGVAIHQQLGMALLRAQRPGDAVEALKKALAKNEGQATTYYYLGLAHRSAGNPRETRKSLIKALEIEPAMAQAWCALAMLDEEAENWPAAAGSFRRAIAANRKFASAYLGLARVLIAGGKHAEAADVLRQKQAAVDAAPSSSHKAHSVAELERQLTPTEEQAQVHFAMSALMNVFPPGQAPAPSVTGLYQRYAPRFDEHLTKTLEYQTPQRLTQLLIDIRGADQTKWDVLDLGCGTGLCGPLLRPMAKTLAGVDLSPAMLEQARQRNVYDRLEVGGLVEKMLEAPRQYDLLSAADVLIYLGDLAPTFEAAAGALHPGGLFVFTVEAGNCDRFQLDCESRRYAHSKPYLLHLARIFGFEPVHLSQIAIRKEREQPVEGHLVALRLSAG